MANSLAVWRPGIRVARPADWTGELVRFGAWIVAALGIVTALLVRLPQPWVDAAGGFPELVRAALATGVLFAVALAEPWIVGRLPSAPAWIGGRLWIPSPLGRLRVPLADIAHVDIEQRPQPLFEVVVVELRDGSLHELCPLAWDGAAGMYAALSRRIHR